MDVAPNSTASEDSNATPGLTKNEELACPVCNEKTVDLLQLNNHLDRTHGFAEEPDQDELLQKNDHRFDGTKHKSKPLAAKTKFTLNRSHWIEPHTNHSRCHKCCAKLNRSTGHINCRKCGELFCIKHCQNVIKLNVNAEYDPRDGKWCRCCQQCAQDKPGYNDFASFRSRTSEFKKLRSSRTEDRQLQFLQLENRFVRLMNGILRINARYQGSMLASFKIPMEISQLERNVVPWTPDDLAIACTSCRRQFGLTLRKHHCRLCGKLVCDNAITKCSNNIPVTNLVNAASDLPIAKPADAASIETSIRVCSSCVQSLFRKRKFEKELAMPLSILFQLYERMSTISSVVLSIVANLEEASQTNSSLTTPDPSEVAKLSKTRRKMVDSFSTYDQLTKQLLRLKPRNASEGRIQSAIISRASSFIQENMLPLGRLTAKLTSQSPSPGSSQERNSDNSNKDLSIKEIKDYRTQLMVIKEQKFLVEDMIATATKHRKFDEALVLSKNLEELNLQADGLTNLLGGEGFS
ncbi:LAFA_0G18734g1_1 [Lachancea sp. 'fantastica']|nr:LAFA_0G18734g1_1 [Lachancea sp. 'fantastica']